MSRSGARAYLLVLAVALAASANSLRNGFVYDDTVIVVENPLVHGFDPGAIIGNQYWPRSFGDDPLYRPVTTLSLALDWRLGNGAPLPFHVTNVALHLAVVALVLALAAVVLPPAAAVVAALLFAVHPVHVEAVANVVGRAELLAALGYLAVVLLFVTGGPATGRRRLGRGIAVFAAAAFAVGAKENALTLPATLLVADVAVARAAGERLALRLRRTWPLWLAVLLAFALYFWLRSGAVVVGLADGPVAAGLEGTNAPQRFVIMLPVYARWALLMVLPFRLLADYSPNVIIPTLAPGPWHLAGLVVVLGSLVLAWRLRHRVPAVTLGVAWVVITASVMANVAVRTEVLLAERTLYLPSLGAVVALAALWALLPARRATWYATALFLVLLGARTIERNTMWRDNDEFFARLARETPESYRRYWRHGAWEFRRGNAALGERLYRQALAIQPLDVSLMDELGTWYLRYGQHRPADQLLTMVLRIDSARYGSAQRAIIARTEGGLTDSAVALARWSASRWPDRAGVLMAAMRALHAGGHAAEAAALAPALVAADTASWQYLQIAGDALARAGACDSARALVRRAAAHAPAGETAPQRLLQLIGTGPECARRFQ